MLIDTVTIQNLVLPSATSDRYGNPEYTTANVVEQARIQPLTAEELTALRDTRISTHRIFLKADSTINAMSRVIWGARNFEVTGRPGLHEDGDGSHHIEAELREEEG
jgi:head-tail adaptor